MDHPFDRNELPHSGAHGRTAREATRQVQARPKAVVRTEATMTATNAPTTNATKRMDTPMRPMGQTLDHCAVIFL